MRGKERAEAVAEGTEGTDAYKLRQIPKEDLIPKYGQGLQGVSRLQGR